MKTRLSNFVLISALALLFTACGSSSNNDTSTPTTPTPTTPTPTTPTPENNISDENVTTDPSLPITGLLSTTDGLDGTIVPLVTDPVYNNLLPVLTDLLSPLMALINGEDVEIFTVVNGLVTPVTDMVGATGLLLSVEDTIVGLLQLDNGIVSGIIPASGGGFNSDGLLGAPGQISGIPVLSGGLLTDILPTPDGFLNPADLQGLTGLLPFDLPALDGLTDPIGLLDLNNGVIEQVLVLVEGVVQAIVNPSTGDLLDGSLTPTQLTDLLGAIPTDGIPLDLLPTDILSSDILGGLGDLGFLDGLLGSLGDLPGLLTGLIPAP